MIDTLEAVLLLLASAVAVVALATVWVRRREDAAPERSGASDDR